MSRYNHFAKEVYQSICFGSIKVGEKFRMDKFSGKRRRRDIVMVKTGDATYKEFKSGKKYSLAHTAVYVSSYDLKRPLFYN